MMISERVLDMETEKNGCCG